MSKRSVSIVFIIFIILSSFTIIIPLLAFIPFEYKYNDGPYLIWTDDPKTTMTIVWMTKDPELGELKYGKYGRTPYYMETVFEMKYDTLHIIKLDNLNPDTSYFYKIPTLGKKIYRFKTAPDKIESFNFIVIGDIRQETIKRSAYDEIVEAIHPYEYEFVINSGDLVDQADDLESWHNFFSVMKKQAKDHPYMVAIGNHEIKENDEGLDFRDFFPYNYAHPPDYYYSFDYSNAHFVMLDNYDVPDSDGNYISDEQKKWLSEELDYNRDKWLFVVFHVPPYSTARYNMNEQLISQLCPLFYEYEVDVVLNGHEHNYESFWVNKTEDWGGTFYFVSGGGGAPTSFDILDRKENPWKHIWHNASIEPYQNDYITLHDQLYGELAFHFMYFEVNDNTLHIQAIREDGSLMQEFYITK
ncbi:MAG: metallophosphoesterase [Promethearchaeota archaeon]